MSEVNWHWTTIDELTHIFHDLTTPDKGRLNTIEIATQPARVFIAKTADAGAAILIERSTPPGLVAKTIGRLSISSHEWAPAGDLNRASSLLLTLNSKDPSALRGFLIAALGLIPQVLDSGDEAAVALLSDLALALNPGSDRQKSVRGLWAELYCMSLFPKLDDGVAAWQRNPTNRFDFAFKDVVLEVKSFSGTQRLHEFRHQQTHAPAEKLLLVASLRLEEVASGISLADLALKTIAGLSSSHDRLRVARAVSAAEGDDQQSSQLLFDLSAAGNSLQFFRGDGIPRFPLLLPEGIVDARLSIDFGSAKPSATGFAECARSIAGLF